MALVTFTTAKNAWSYHSAPKRTGHKAAACRIQENMRMKNCIPEAYSSRAEVKGALLACQEANFLHNQIYRLPELCG